MAATLVPASPRTGRTPSTVDIFSAAAKGFQNPDFAIETRKPKPPSLPAPSFEAQWSPPDEEKGRSMRSAGSRSTSAASLDFGDRSLDSGDSSADTLLNEDDDFLDGWLADKKEGGTQSVLEGMRISSATEQEVSWQDEPAPASGVDWTNVLATAIFTVKEKIDLSAQELYEVPDSIWELSTTRKILPPRSESALPAFTRTLTRTQSGPVILGGSSAPKLKTRRFERTSSGSLGYSTSEAPPASVPLQLDLSKNHLTASSISHALFTLPNLKCLFLRQNELQRLPEGIGRLAELVELSLWGNQLEFLPAEILRLPKLAKLSLHPNPFLPPPPPANDLSPCHRILGKLVIHFEVPSLAETCTRYLLTSEGGHSTSKPRIHSYELPSTLSYHLRRPFQTTLSPPSATSGSSFSAANPRRQRERTASANSYLSASTSSFHSTTTAVEDDDDMPYDPLANICRSPAHPDEDKVFFKHAVERIEWVEERCLKLESGSRDTRLIPIRHRGCSLRCLDWLEEPLPSVEEQ